MAHFDVTAVAEIDAPLDRVWALISDTRRYAEWVVGTSEVTRTDGPAKAGGTYDERNAVIGPITASSRWRIMEYDEPHRQVHVSSSIPVLKQLEIRMTTESLDADRTHFTLNLRGHSALGPLGVLAVNGMRSSVERNSRETAANLKAMCEVEERTGAPPDTSPERLDPSGS